MDVTHYTDQKYTAISQLEPLGPQLVAATKKYRQPYIRHLKLDQFQDAIIIETPALIKARYIKNVELKGQINLFSPDYDYVLELAKLLVSNKLPPSIVIKDQTLLQHLFQTNNYDLTIITHYLTTLNHDLIKVLPNESNHNLLTLTRFFPELSAKEIKFLQTYHRTNCNYDLVDFQKLTNSAYETARKSMAKLATIKLYAKHRVGKKFTYQPTTKLITLLKEQRHEHQTKI